MRWWVTLGIIGSLTVAAYAAVPDVAKATQDLQARFPGVQVYQELDGRPTRVWGTIFGVGATPEMTAESFVRTHSEALNVASADLVAGNTWDGTLTVPVMWQPETGTYKFILVYYHQERDGIPVYGSDLRLLVRNEADYPLVLASANLRELGDYAVPTGATRAVADAAAANAAIAKIPSLTTFGNSSVVIWAGTEDKAETPRLALTFVADNYAANNGLPQRQRFIADAATGEILHSEDLIVDVNVTGTVTGMATTLPKSDTCNPEVSTAMPYAKVTIGTTSAFADAFGNFTITNSGSTSVTVSSPMSGQYFVVNNYSGSTETLSAMVTPPGPVNFVHNSANTTEGVRSQVNAYVQANKVRDFVLTYSPSYPTVSTQTNFQIYVNRTDGYCPANAWYDGTSLNFCSSSGSYPNTAFSSVVHHEYGHHLVAMAGSGQDQYGEGIGDCVGMLIADDPILGYGFEGNCSAGIRSASNAMQYPCSSDIHTCAQLLSGCVWSVRNQLIINYPTTYLSILSPLLVNSILLHSGGSITPQIAIDFLTLDDTDGNIYNGTPHYPEICTGFGAHNMTCPALVTGINVTPGNGLEATGDPGGPFAPSAQDYVVKNIGGTALNYQVTATQPWVTVTNGSGTLAGSASTTVTVSINANANSLAVGTYTDTVSFVDLTTGAGNTTRPITLHVGGPQIVVQWNLDTNPGWTTTGSWTWGTPLGGAGDHGNPDPTAGYTGTKVYGYNLGSGTSGGYANSMPERALTTTAINCTGYTQIHLKFWRWLGVEQSDYDHAYVRVSNNGSTWTTIWSNPNTTMSETAWSQQDYDISAYADNQATVYIRWVMGTTDNGWTYCGWNIDDIQIWGLSSCSGPSFSQQPQSATRCSGQSVTFSVTAAGSGTLTYQWRKGGNDIGGATGNSYTINAVATGDIGSYDCVVTNDCGSVPSNAATLAVNTGPQISGQPASQSVAAGSSVSFTVTATGSGTLSYQWRKGGTDIGGATGSTYTIDSVTTADAGDYDCVVTNGCGSVPSDAATLSVSPAVCVGDANCDGTINWRDIDYLVAAQNDNVSAWTALFPGGPSCTIANVDVNGDEHVNWRDIDPFIALMNTSCP